MQDITDQRQAGDASRESEARFRDMAEIAGDWFWETDRDLRFTHMSPHVRQLGVEPDFYIGRTYAEIHGKPPGAGHLVELIAMRARKAFSDIERPSQVAPGHWVRMSARPIYGANDQFMGYRGATTDITEYKIAEVSVRESEEKFAAFLRNRMWVWRCKIPMDGGYWSIRPLPTC